MPSIGTNSKPAYVYDAGTDTWIPIGPGEHTHDYAASAHNHDSTYIAKTLTTTTGDIIYASAANTPARLGIGSTDQVLKVSGGVPVWGASPSPSFVGVSAYGNNVSESYTANVIKFLSLPSEYFDTDGFHSTSTNTGRLTIPSGKAGKYLLNAVQRTSSTGTGSVYLYMRKNGTTYFGEESVLYMNLNNVGNTYAVNASFIADLAVGDYVEVATAISNTATAPTYTNFQMVYLGA